MIFRLIVGPDSLAKSGRSHHVELPFGLNSPIYGTFLKLGEFLSRLLTVQSHYIQESDYTPEEQRLLFVGLTVGADHSEKTK